MYSHMDFWTLNLTDTFTFYLWDESVKTAKGCKRGKWCVRNVARVYACAFNLHVYVYSNVTCKVNISLLSLWQIEVMFLAALVCLSVCLFVCLFLCLLTTLLKNRFGWNFMERSRVVRGKIRVYMGVMICFSQGVLHSILLVIMSG